jgi:hypothetical protein
MPMAANGAAQLCWHVSSHELEDDHDVVVIEDARGHVSRHDMEWHGYFDPFLREPLSAW